MTEKISRKDFIKAAGASLVVAPMALEGLDRGQKSPVQLLGEQKAVVVLLSLLALGIQGISIGPRPPAFITPNVFKVLQDQFDLKLTGDDAKADVAAALA